VTGWAAGWTETHGGDQARIEFKIMSIKLVRELSEIENSRSTSFILNHIVDSIPVFVTDEKLLIGQQEKVALSIVKKDINTITGEIWINAANWSQLSLEQKELTLLHELLHFTATTDDDFSLSTTFYQMIQRYRIVRQSHPDIKSYVVEGFLRCSIDEFATAGTLLSWHSVETLLQQTVTQNNLCDKVTIFIENYFEIIGEYNLPN